MFLISQNGSFFWLKRYDWKQNVVFLHVNKLNNLRFLQKI